MSVATAAEGAVAFNAGVGVGVIGSVGREVDIRKGESGICERFYLVPGFPGPAFAFVWFQSLCWGPEGVALLVSEISWRSGVLFRAYVCGWACRQMWKFGVRGST